MQRGQRGQAQCSAGPRYLELAGFMKCSSAGRAGAVYSVIPCCAVMQSKGSLHYLSMTVHNHCSPI